MKTTLSKYILGEYDFDIVSLAVVIGMEHGQRKGVQVKFISLICILSDEAISRLVGVHMMGRTIKI